MGFTVINGRVFTGNQEKPWVTSFSVDGEVITSVDSTPRHGDTIIDARGRLIVPGFGDGHAHPMFGGYEFLGPVLKGKSTLQELLASVKKFADENPDMPWIQGGSYESWMVPGGEFDARWLDDVVPDRPVVLRATDYHTVWCNTAALSAAGITADTPDPEIGWIMRREDGTPMGTLREWDAVDLVLNVAPERTLDEKVLALELAGREFARTGITWVQDAWVDPGMAEAYVAAAQEGKLGIRYNLALRADPKKWREQLDWMVSTRKLFDNIDQVSCNTVKFFADGVIEGHTAALRQAYTDDPHNHGMPCWDWDELRACVSAVDDLGFQPHIHAIGDEGLHEAINAIEFAQKANRSQSHPRPVITHVQLLDPADLPRFAQLGIVANFEALWACNDPLQSELTAPHVGHEREMWQYPMKSMLDSGAPISMGSDWPVTDLNPLACMEVAITRLVPEDPTSTVWNPGERLSPVEAVTAYTLGSAYQAGADHLWGSIEVGKAADFAILNQNIFDIAPTDIHTIQVDGTWCGGKQIFSRKDAN